MSLQTFSPPQNPNIGLSKASEPRVLIAAFGDGYEQRIADGLNTIRRSWELEWSPISVENADAIENFLIARNGVEAFYWTPPHATTPVKVRCARWRRANTFWNHDALSASFIEVFDLGT
jgi:phage-related protein